ncbi:MAG: response regulator [bacterium]
MRTPLERPYLTRESRRVLVVDGDPSVRTMLGVALRRSGFEVHEASDGVDVLRACREHRFDVVLVDLELRGKDGLTLMREIRAESPRARLVAMSAAQGVDGFAAPLEVRQAGGTAFLAKPMGLGDLLGCIEAVLGGRGHAVEPPTRDERMTP